MKREGGGRRDKSGRSKEGVAATMAAAGRHRGQRNESGRGEEQVAAMMAASMSLCGRRAADDATSQTAGRQTMQREQAVTTVTIDLIGRQILQQKLAPNDGQRMTGGGQLTADNDSRQQKIRHGRGGRRQRHKIIQ